MKTFSKLSQIKAESRERLLGNYAKLISVFITIELIIYFLDYLADSVTYGMAYGNILYYIFIILINLFLGLLLAGNSYLYLNFISGAPFRSTDLFHNFRVHPDKVIALQAVFILTEIISFVPGYVLFRIYLSSHDLGLLFIAIFLELIGLLLAVYVYLNFTLCFYMLHDFPDYSTGKLLHLCNQIMKGYKRKLFTLEFSFIPLYLLCILSFGLGFLWIMPYVFTTRTSFYLELMEHRTPD